MTYCFFFHWTVVKVILRLSQITLFQMATKQVGFLCLETQLFWNVCISRPIVSHKTSFRIEEPANPCIHDQRNL